MNSTIFKKMDQGLAKFSPIERLATEFFQQNNFAESKKEHLISLRPQ